MTLENRIKNLAHECAVEAYEQDAYKVTGPLPGDWEVFHDMASSADVEHLDLFEEEYQEVLTALLDEDGG